MTNFVERTSGLLVKPSANVDLTERIAELEFALEDQDWIQLAGAGSTEFSTRGRLAITRLARIMYIKNPLIQRGVKVKADYIFGRGVNITARNLEVNKVLQTFLDDERNQTELTSQQARIQKEIELEVDGEIFFVLFVHPSTGRVRVRSIPVEEITEISTNPKDRKEAWYYRRVWNEQTLNEDSGETATERREAWYVDWRYKATPPTRIGSVPVERGVIYHVKIGGFSDWLRGLSEVYAAIDWSKAYKLFLENWSAITAAYARFAFKISTAGGARGVAAAKAKLGSTIGNAVATPAERVPPPAVASNFIAQQDKVDIDPIRTAGATTSPSDGRRLLLMVAAAFGLPETFFGDVSVGTLATARSLDRPTELGFVNRQTLWADVYHDIAEFVKFWAVRAPNGPLRTYATLAVDEYQEEYITFDDDINAHVDVDFPSIVEHSLGEYIGALNTGATYIPDQRELARMVLTALGENDVDELLDRMYPADGTPSTDPATDPLASLGSEVLQATEMLREAITTLREALYDNNTTTN